MGPFPLSQLLEKIEGNTLVYRDGIDWTTAKDLEELKKFFPAEKVVVKTVVEEKVKIIDSGSSHGQTSYQTPQSLPNLYRSTDSKLIFGFCGGLAHKFNVNVLFIRALVFFSFYLFIGWAYFLTFLLPSVSTKK